MARATAALSLLLVLLLPVATAGSDSATAAQNRSQSRLRGQQQLEAAAALDIPSRRQWDCNLAGISCCTAPPPGLCAWTEEGPMLDRFMDSCLGSPSPWTGAPNLRESDCRCGENQCDLTNLCPSSEDQPVNGTGGKCSSDDNTEADLRCKPANPPIPDCTGYCGETSTQESLLYWGTYISQGQVRRLNYLNKHPPATWREEHQLLIDAIGFPGYKENDMEQAMRSLQFQVFPWYFKETAGCGANPPCQCNTGGEGGFPEFHEWVKCNLKKGLPVIIGVVIGAADRDDPTYDHIVTAVGTQGEDLLVNNHYSNKRQVLVMKPVKNGKHCNRLGRWICPSSQNFGVALRPRPNFPTWAVASARLAVVGCSGPQQFCRLAQRDGVDKAYWREPNYRVRGIQPVNLTLRAEPAGELPPDAVAVKRTWSSSSPERGAAEAYKRNEPPSVECFETGGSKGAISVGEVRSDAISFVHFCRKSDMAEAGCP